MKDVTYGEFICTVRQEKAEKNRIHFTVGSNQISYPGNDANPTAEMLVAKILFNCVISTKRCRIHYDGHSQLLSHDTAQSAQIHPYHTHGSDRQNYQRIQLEREGDLGWIRLH